MKSAPRISLLLVLLLGFAWPVFGQGSMARYGSSAQGVFGRGKTPASPSTNGFTISAQRDFDRSVAIAVSSATRYWFLDSYAPSETLIASSNQKYPMPGAQAAPGSSGRVLVVAARSPNTPGLLLSPSTRTREHDAGYTDFQFETAVALYDEGQLASWVQRNVRLAKTDPRPR